MYQGRFKSFPAQEDAHFLTLCRYVEANALRAGLVRRAEDWRWSSAFARSSPKENAAILRSHLSEWPTDPPRSWLAELNRPMAEDQLKEVHC